MNISNKIYLIACISFLFPIFVCAEQIPISANNNLGNINDIVLNNVPSTQNNSIEQKENIQNQNNVSDYVEETYQSQYKDLSYKEITRIEKLKHKQENKILKEMKSLAKQDEKARKLNTKMRLKEEKKFPRDMAALAKRDKKNKAALAKLQAKISKIQTVRGVPSELDTTYQSDTIKVEEQPITQTPIVAQESVDKGLNVVAGAAAIPVIPNNQNIEEQNNLKLEDKTVTQPQVLSEPNQIVISTTTKDNAQQMQNINKSTSNTNTKQVKKVQNTGNKQLNKVGASKVAVKKKNNINKNKFKQSVKFVPMFVTGSKQLTKECEWEIEQLVEKLNNDKNLGLVIEVKGDKKKTANSDKLISQRAQEIAIKFVNNYKIKNNIQIKKIGIGQNNNKSSKTQAPRQVKQNNVRNK